MELTEGDRDSDRIDDGMSCDTFDPNAPTAPHSVLTWEPSILIAMDDEAGTTVPVPRDLPPSDHLYPLLLPEEFGQLQSITLGNLNVSMQWVCRRCRTT